MLTATGTVVANLLAASPRPTGFFRERPSGYNHHLSASPQEKQVGQSFGVVMALFQAHGLCKCTLRNIQPGVPCTIIISSFIHVLDVVGEV